MYEPSIVKWINKMFNYSFSKEWYETYWAFDLHGTVIKPNYKQGILALELYDYAKESLQILTKRHDIILFTYTSSYPEELKFYLDELKKVDIHFNYVNENPEISDSTGAFGYYKFKPYFNVMFEDKAGFFPETDWEPVYKCLLEWDKKQPPIKWKENFNKK